MYWHCGWWYIRWYKCWWHDRRDSCGSRCRLYCSHLTSSDSSWIILIPVPHLLVGGPAQVNHESKIGDRFFRCREVIRSDVTRQPKNTNRPLANIDDYGEQLNKKNCALPSPTLSRGLLILANLSQKCDFEYSGTFALSLRTCPYKNCQGLTLGRQE